MILLIGLSVNRPSKKVCNEPAPPENGLDWHAQTVAVGETRRRFVLDLFVSDSEELRNEVVARRGWRHRNMF